MQFTFIAVHHWHGSVGEYASWPALQSREEGRWPQRGTSMAPGALQRFWATFFCETLTVRHSADVHRKPGATADSSALENISTVDAASAFFDTGYTDTHDECVASNENSPDVHASVNRLYAPHVRHSHIAKNLPTKTLRQSLSIAYPCVRQQIRNHASGERSDAALAVENFGWKLVARPKWKEVAVEHGHNKHQREYCTRNSNT